MCYVSIASAESIAPYNVDSGCLVFEQKIRRKRYYILNEESVCREEKKVHTSINTEREKARASVKESRHTELKTVRSKSA